MSRTNIRSVYDEFDLVIIKKKSEILEMTKYLFIFFFLNRSTSSVFRVTFFKVELYGKKTNIRS